MSKIDVEQLRALGDYTKLTDWSMAFPVLPLVGALGGFASEDLNLRCEAVDLPKGSNQKIEITTRGHKTFQNGLNDLGHTTTITFNDTIDNKIFSFVTLWAQLTRDYRTGKSFKKAELEAIIVITQYDANDNAIRAWELVGCLYESDEFGALDSASSDIQKPTLTVSFDYFKPIRLSA